MYNGGMHSSLIPEPQLLISPALASTIGLEEATMLSVLSNLILHRETRLHEGFRWLQLRQETVSQYMPFWNDHDIQRISTSLKDKGILLLGSAPYSQCHTLTFAFNEQQTYSANQQAQTPPQSSAREQITPGNTLLPPNWRPSQEVLERLSQHNVPPHFAHEQLPEFVTFWRESGESHRSWGNKFFKQVLRRWEEHRARQSSRPTAAPISRDWRPSMDAMEILRRKQIPQDFIDDAIAEFILYWQEKGEASQTWNSRFMNHVNRQWAKVTHALQHDTEPRPIPADWRPSPDVYEVLDMANIDLNFAREQEKEFVIYWLESKQLYHSWNSKFLQHVKYRWAQRHNMSGQAPGHSSDSTRERSINDNLSDRSWAY